MLDSRPPAGYDPRYQNGNDPNHSIAGLKASLLLFFELRDSKYQSIVEDLFSLYEFPDIAHGIFLKYKTLPIGWKAELTKLKYRADDYNQPSLEWLDLNTVKWYSETTDTYPSVDKTLRFPPRKPHEEPEKVVDEFIENERKYFDKLQAFMKCYVSEVEAIAENKIGERAKKSLGLSKEQAKYVFGTHLLHVYQVVERLLIALETLIIVPKIPKTKGGRPAHLARVLTLFGQGLVDAYAPYNARYQVAKRVLERQTNFLNEHFLPPPPRDEIMRHLNFKELWNEISQSKPELKNLGIDSILIMPIRRFPNYKLFVDRLCKTLTPNHSAYEDVFMCLKAVDGFTRKIDDAVKLMAETEENNFRILTGDDY